MRLRPALRPSSPHLRLALPLQAASVVALGLRHARTPAAAACLQAAAFVALNRARRERRTACSAASGLARTPPAIPTLALAPARALKACQPSQPL